MPSQLVLEVLEIDAAVGVLTDRDDVGDRLSPWELVRVVLVRADEDDGALARARVARSRNRSGSRSPSTCTSLSIAPVEPVPQKTTTSSLRPFTARWMIWRASSRSAVICLPVADASVCVFA